MVSPTLTSQGLKLVQNGLARLVTKSPLFTRSLPLPVRCRILFKINLLTYKTLREKQPVNLHAILPASLPSRSLRSNNYNSLSVSRVKTNTGVRAFHSCAPSRWKNLLLSVRSAISVPTFKKHLKAHLFDFAPPPPPIDTVMPDGLLMLRDCFFDFAAEHWFGYRATEPGFAGDIGAKKVWLIDWYCPWHTIFMLFMSSFIHDALNSCSLCFQVHHLLSNLHVVHLISTLSSLSMCTVYAFSFHAVLYADLHTFLYWRCPYFCAVLYFPIFLWSVHIITLHIKSIFSRCPWFCLFRYTAIFMLFYIQFVNAVLYSCSPFHHIYSFLTILPGTQSICNSSCCSCCSGSWTSSSLSVKWCWLVPLHRTTGPSRNPRTSQHSLCLAQCGAPSGTVHI